MKPEESNISVEATASATVANQPTYDGGGFPIRVEKVIAGKSYPWETLQDRVRLTVSGPWTHDEKPHIAIVNHVEEADAPPLPTRPEDNTAGRAVLEVVSMVRGSLPRTLRIDVYKGISVKGTGLGSSGATAAAALKASEHLMERGRVVVGPNFEQNTTKARLLKIADRGVPDNAIPAYFGGMMQIFPDGFVQRIERHPDFGKFVVATPRGFGIETAAARKALAGKSPPENEGQLREQMIDALRQGFAKRYAELMEEAHEWFVEPRTALYPHGGGVFQRVYDAARDAGALGVTISGAGPSMLAVVPNPRIGEAVGKAMYRAFGQEGYDSIARLVDIDMKGAHVVHSEKAP